MVLNFQSFWLRILPLFPSRSCPNNSFEMFRFGRNRMPMEMPLVPLILDFDDPEFVELEACEFYGLPMSGCECFLARWITKQIAKAQSVRESFADDATDFSFGLQCVLHRFCFP